MADILTIIAAVEWMALGLLVSWKLKKWNKVFQDLYDELKEDMERWKEWKSTSCKYCRYYPDAKVNEKGFLICPASGMEITETDFCSYGQRKIETVLPKSDAKVESLEGDQ